MELSTKVGLYWDDHTVGEQYKTASRTITDADLMMFAGLTGDYNALHTDEEYMKTSQFGTRIAHGAMNFAYGMGLLVRTRRTEGTSIAFAGCEMKFVGPVKSGDTIHCEVTVLEKKETKKPDRGLITQQINVVNQRGETAVSLKATTMLRRRPK